MPFVEGVILKNSKTCDVTEADLRGTERNEARCADVYEEQITNKVRGEKIN